MKPLAALLFLLFALLAAGCESTTVDENYGYGMEFSEDANADQAKVID